MPSARSSRVNSTLARIAVRPPANRASEGAQTLNSLLGGASRLVRREPLPRQYNTVINWGNSNELSLQRSDVRIINKPEAVRRSVNKLSAFECMRIAGVRVPEYSAYKPSGSNETSDIWLCRSTLTGSGGVGISVVRSGESFPNAPLYVKYVRKTAEYRIHVAFGKAFFCQFKLRDSQAQQTDDQKLIRNHDNGWVFAPRDLSMISASAIEEAEKAIAALGLDFGAVDMVLSKRENLPYVLEVNTAPGLQSPTLKEAYESVFKEALL